MRLDASSGVRPSTTVVGTKWINGGRNWNNIAARFGSIVFTACKPSRKKPGQRAARGLLHLGHYPVVRGILVVEGERNRLHGGHRATGNEHTTTSSVTMIDKYKDRYAPSLQARICQSRRQVPQRLHFPVLCAAVVPPQLSPLGPGLQPPQPPFADLHSNCSRAALPVSFALLQQLDHTVTAIRQ